MMNLTVQVPPARNEPIQGYAPGSPERMAIKAALTRLAGERAEVPLLINGKAVRSNLTSELTMPHRHRHVLGTLHEAQAQHAGLAVAAAMKAKPAWSSTAFGDRAAVFLRAADLLATHWRARVNAATMLGQSKTVYQSEIDAICEAADFLRFNVQFASHIQAQQPESPALTWNQTDYRALDGFVFAIAPFNFTSIALNLCTAPALMGNTVILKPSNTAALSNFYLMEVLREAGLPDGVINFLPGDGPTIGNVVLSSPDLGGVHFTGSTRTFHGIWKHVGENIGSYRQFPRLVGETGGKDFIFAHASAADDVDALAVAIVRGGFEYQGQKCSACSRVYLPESLWPTLKPRLLAMVAELKMGDVEDFRNFMGAVIDETSFRKVSSYLELARTSPEATVLAGGTGDGSEGYFIAPTLVQVTNPRHRLMVEEIFAPFVTLYVYPDSDFEQTLEVCDQSAPYALTGAVFARDRAVIAQMSHALRHAAGNFYINDKPTGAVVGQQPFGGSRASGTNDKAGSALNLLRWTSPRTVKESFVPPTSYRYPFMDAE